MTSLMATQFWDRNSTGETRSSNDTMLNSIKKKWYVRQSYHYILITAHQIWSSLRVINFWEITKHIKYDIIYKL